MANELGTGGLLGALTGKNGANASSVSSHHTAMVTGASGRAKDAAAPMITIGNMTVNNDSSDGSVIKTIENNNQYKPADTSMLKMGGFFSTASSKLESVINKQTELIERQSTAIISKLEGVQAAVSEMNQAINKAMSAQISSFESYSEFVKKQNAKTTLMQDVWMVISSDARRKEAAEKNRFNSNQMAVWSKSDTFSLTKTIPNALAKINENLVTRFTDPKVRRILISETLEHYQRVYKYMQDIAAGIENIRYNTHPIEQYVKHEFDVYNRKKRLGIYDPNNPNNQNRNAPPPPQEAVLRRAHNFDPLTTVDIEEALKLKAIDPRTGKLTTLKKAMKSWDPQLADVNKIISDKSYITKFLTGGRDIQKNFRKAILDDIKKKKKKDSIDNISDKNLKALIAPTEDLTKATMLSASSNEKLQGQMKRLGLAVDTNTSTVEKVSSAMSATMKLFTRFVNFKTIFSLLPKLLKFYSMFRLGKSILGLARGGIGLASSGSDKISSGFNWLKDRVPFVKSISDAIGSWWDKAKNYFLDKIGPTIETYVTTPIVEKTTSLFDRVFGSGTFKNTLNNISNYSNLIFTSAFGKDPAKREQAWSTLKNGITSGYETIVKKYIIPAIAKVVFAIYSIKNFTKTIGKIPGAFSTLGKMWDAGYTSGNWANFRAGFVNAYTAGKQGDLRGFARGVRSGINSKFNLGKAFSHVPGVNYLQDAWNGRILTDSAGNPLLDAAGNVRRRGGIHGGLKQLSQLYNVVVRGISNAIHGTGPKSIVNGVVTDTSSKFNVYKSVENFLHAIGSAPKKIWEVTKNTYTGIRTHAITFRSVLGQLGGSFHNLKTSIVGLPGKFTAMKTAFGGFGKMSWAGVKGLGKGIFGSIAGGSNILVSLLPLAKGLASLATGVGIPIAIIAFLMKMIMPYFRSAQSKGVGVGQYLKDTIVGWFENIKKTINTELGGFGGIVKIVMSGIIGVFDGIWTGMKSLFNANSTGELILNILKALLEGVVAMLPFLFKMIGKGLKTTLWDIPKALLWDLPKMLISSLFGSSSGDKVKVKAHAKGGIVDSPTYFKFGKGGTTQTGLMGEAGPEAILKLRRGKDGVLGVSIADSSNSLQQAIKLLDRTNAVTSTAMKRLTDAITRPNSFYDQKTVKQFTSTFKKLNISSDKMSQLTDIVKKNAGKEVTVDNIYELVDVLNGISSEQKDGNKSQKKANDDQTKRDTERNKTLTDSKKVSETIKENLPEKGFWDKFAGWWEDSKRNLVRAWAGFIGDYSYAKMTDSKSIDMFGASVKDVERVLGDLVFTANNTVDGLMATQPGSDDTIAAQNEAKRLKNLLKAYENDSLTESGINDINTLIKINGKKILGYNPLDSLPGKAYNVDNLVKILAESKKFNEDTLKGVKSVLEIDGGVLQGDNITKFMEAINKTPDFSEDIYGKIKETVINLDGKQVTEDTMNEIVKIVKGIEENQKEEANNNNEENVAENTFKKTLQNQIKSIKEYFIGGKFYADIDKAKMTVGGIMKTIGNSIYSLITGKQNAVIGNALKDTFGAGFGGLAAGLMGDSRAYEFISKINENAVKHGHSDIQRMMTSAKHTILSDVSDIAQFTKDTKITSEELASILKDAKKYGWNINAESFKKLDAQIKGIPYVPEGKDGKTNSQTEGTSVTQGKADQILIHTPTRTAKRIEFDAKHLDKSSEDSLLRSIKKASDKATDDRTKATYSKLSEALSTGKFESLSEFDWETLKNLSPENKETVSKMQGTINNVRFETYTHKLLNTEGGYVKYTDKNGVVHEDNRGISKGTLSVAIDRGIIEKGTNIKDLTKEQAIEIYRKMYWDVKDGPKMYKLPHPIDYLVYDTHVNGGALPVLRNTLEQLGVSGYDKAGFDKTFGAVIDYCQSPEKTKKFGETFLKARGKYYIGVVKRDNTKSNWLQGWFNRLEIVSKQTGLESPFKDGTLVAEANKLMNEINPGKSIKITDTSTVKGAAENASSDKSTNDSGSIDVEKLNEKATEQATANLDNLIKNIDQLRNAVSSKEKDFSDLSQTEIIGGEYSKGWAKAHEDLKNLNNIYEKAKSGSDLAESDIELLNDAAKTYGGKPIDFNSYKKVVDEKATDTSAVASASEASSSVKPAESAKLTGVGTVTTAVDANSAAKSNKPQSTVASTTEWTEEEKKRLENSIDQSNKLSKLRYDKFIEPKRHATDEATATQAAPQSTNAIDGSINVEKLKDQAPKQATKKVVDEKPTGEVARTVEKVGSEQAKTKTATTVVSNQSTSTSKYSDYSLEELWENRPKYKSLAEILTSNLSQDEKQRQADDFTAWYDAYSKRRRESALAKKQTNQQPAARTNGAIKVEAQVKPADQSKNTINHMEVTFQGRPELVNAINADFENSMNGRASNSNIADSINANKMLDQLVEDSKKEAAARKAKEEVKRVKVDGRYAGFVQNLIHETELDIQGKSWYESASSERSKLETLTKVLDEIKSGYLSASTRNFLNENKDKFESYLDMNSVVTQFKMSDAAKSGLIELLKKKQAIAAKDKDGGLFTSNSTMVAAKRTYEALDRALKEVQTDSLTNASMNLLFDDKDLHKYVKNLSYQPTAIDETLSKEIPDAAFDLSKTAEKANIKHQQMVQQALEQVTDEDFKKDPYTALQNAVNALREATALQYVALTKMERPNVANVNNATVSTNSTSSILANQSNADDSYGHTNPLDAWMSGSNAILSSSQYWSL